MSAQTRREREKAMHRQEILEAAARVFAKKGFAATTVEEIAQEAEFSKGAVYLHFDSKEALFLCLIEERLNELEAGLRQVVERDNAPEAKIRDVVRTHLSFFEQDKDFFQIAASEQPRLEPEAETRLKKEMRERHIRGLDLVERAMKDAVHAGVLKAIDPRLLATGLVGIIHSFTAQWILAGGKGALVEMEPVVLELFLEGARARS